MIICKKIIQKNHKILEKMQNFWTNFPNESPEYLKMPEGKHTKVHTFLKAEPLKDIVSILVTFYYII